MLADKRYVNKDFDTIGPGRLFLLTGTGEDEMLELASILEATKTCDRTKLDQMETHSGVEVPIRTFQRSENYQLSVKFAEQLSPDLIQFLSGDDPTIAAATVTEVKDLLRFTGTDPRLVSHPYGIVSSGPPPTGTPVGTAFGTGGSIAAGTYTIDIEAEYEGGLRSALLEGTTVIVGSGEKVALEWDAPAGGIVPKYYNIYSTDTGETGADRYRWLQVAGADTSCVLDNDPETVEYPGAPGDAYILEDVDAGTTVDSADYTFDTSTGLIQSVSLTDNKLYRLTYNYTQPAQLTFDEGKLSSEPVYRKLVVIQNTSLDSQEKSKTFRFEKVNIRSQGVSEAIQTASFEDGISVTFDCAYDLVTQRVGQKVVNGSIVENWDNAGF